MYLTNVLRTKPQTMLTMWADHRELLLFCQLRQIGKKNLSENLSHCKYGKTPKKKAHQIIVLEYVMLEVMSHDGESGVDKIVCSFMGRQRPFLFEDL